MQLPLLSLQKRIFFNLYLNTRFFKECSLSSKIKQEQEAGREPAAAPGLWSIMQINGNRKVKMRWDVDAWKSQRTTTEIKRVWHILLLHVP